MWPWQPRVPSRSGKGCWGPSGGAQPVLICQASPQNFTSSPSSLPPFSPSHNPVCFLDHTIYNYLSLLFVCWCFHLQTPLRQVLNLSWSQLNPQHLTQLVAHSRSSMNNLTDWQGINSCICHGGKHLLKPVTHWNLPFAELRCGISLLFELADPKILELYFYTFQLFENSSSWSWVHRPLSGYF